MSSTAIRITRFIALALGFLSICMGAHANETKRPVIAVIPIGGAGATPLATLIEARLANNDRYVVVDRERIAEVTKEWELTALSTASSISKRVEMGKLLGADLLVLLSENPTPKPHCEMVISETSRGIRLRLSTFATSNKPENEAKAIEAEIEYALKKQSEGFVRICAVPPFVSMDLSETQAHLKTAYARMLEAMLLRIPGTQVVEIAEARQIAAEITLTGTKVERVLPVYFLGEYRFDAANPDKPPYVRVIAKQGERMVGTREAKSMTPTTAAAFFRDSVMALLAEASGGVLPASDPKAESQLLATRAKEHFALGYYEECVQVAEASLLLEPTQPELHRLAMTAYSRWAEQNKKRPAMELLPCYDLALVHMEQFFLQTHWEKDESGIWVSLTSAFRDTNYMANNADEATTMAVYAHRKRVVESFLRILFSKHQAGTLNDATVSMVFDHWKNSPRFLDQPLQENLRQRLDVADMLLTSKLKHPHWYICSLLDDGMTDDMKQSTEYQWFTTQLKQRDHPAVEAGFQKMADDEARSQARQIERNNSRKKDPDTDPTGPVDLEFVPFEIKRADQRSFSWNGMFRCGDDVDLFWDNRTVCMMRTKGILEPVAELRATQGIGQACFDGKYAWLPLIGDAPGVLVIDLSDGTVVHFTAEDGLLPFRYAAAATLGQGRLCLSAGMRNEQTQRAYIAILELTKDKQKKFRIIHEATKHAIPGQSNKEVRLDSQIEYIPKFMISEPRDGGKSWRALVNKGPTSLWIDPDAGVVKAVDVGTGGVPDLEDVTFHDNAVYYGNLYRLRVETKEMEKVRELPEDGSGYERVLIRDGQLHHVGWFWWVADGIDKPLRKLQGKVPGRMYDIRQLYDSAHYGILFRSRAGSGGAGIYQVKFRNGLLKGPEL